MSEMPSTGEDVEPPRRVHAGIVALQAIALIGLLVWGIAAWAESNLSPRAGTIYPVEAANETPVLIVAQVRPPAPIRWISSRPPCLVRQSRSSRLPSWCTQLLLAPPVSGSIGSTLTLMSLAVPLRPTPAQPLP